MQRLSAVLRDRRRMQSGTTLIELLVSVTIMGLALALIIGTFSTGLLDAALAKRNTSAEAVIQYEMETIRSSQFDSAASYSDCFPTENPVAPRRLASYMDACPSVEFTLRADVQLQPGPTSGSQRWTVKVSSWPTQVQVESLDLFKVNR